MDFDNQCDSLYIGQLSVDVIDSDMTGHNSNSWWKILRVQGVDLNCKLDSGAQANVMFLVTYEGLQMISAMRPTSSSLVAYNNRQIKPLSVVTLAVDVSSRFHVTRPRKDYRLAITYSSGLDSTLDTVIASKLPTTPSNDLLQAYSDVLGGLGRYPGKFHIVL